MNIKGRIVTAVFAAALAVPAISMAQYGNGYGPPPPPPPGQGPGGWDAPPSDFRQDVQRQGWRDGMYGASQDAKNGRRPNVMNRDEYRNYRGPARRLYRAAFQRGYAAFWSHQGGGRPY
ncbi:hypothetical protein [Terriglobus aquaticus]|uniref:Uncharacterized protein n=1 Tax=Terriglobus aquaticus TaxID=940139 RepID=A0ABW9KNL7_9BACT|nr:hypothetical protein [Terriglobus aquaticus]